MRPTLIDLSALFDDWTEPVYIDLYHLSEAGNAAVAEAMLPAVGPLQGAAIRRVSATCGWGELAMEWWILLGLAAAALGVGGGRRGIRKPRRREPESEPKNIYPLW